MNQLNFTPIEAIQAATSEAARALKLYEQTGAIAEGYLADLIVVDGNVHEDVSLLGNPDNIQDVFLNGNRQSFNPLPDRKDPPGWRVSHYGDGILHWQDVMT